MTAFTFEYAEKGQKPLFSETVDIADRAAVWRHVEALALRLGERPGAFIRVRDDRGEAVVRAGVATALASIAACPCAGCVLKTALERGATAAGATTPCVADGARACALPERREGARPRPARLREPSPRHA